MNHRDNMINLTLKLTSTYRKVLLFISILRGSSVNNFRFLVISCTEIHRLAIVNAKLVDAGSVNVV